MPQPGRANRAVAFHIYAPSEQMKSRRRTSKSRVLLGFGGLAIFFFTSIRGLAGFWTDYLWFDSLALSSVWTSVLWAKIGQACCSAIFS